MLIYYILFFFFFNDTATTEIYTLSLHDALPISTHLILLKLQNRLDSRFVRNLGATWSNWNGRNGETNGRSEEHTSELQSQSNLVCRLLLEKKKKKKQTYTTHKNTKKHYMPSSP